MAVFIVGKEPLGVGHYPIGQRGGIKKPAALTFGRLGYLEAGDLEIFGADLDVDVVEFGDEVVVLGVDAAVVNVHVENRCVPMDVDDIGEMELETDFRVAGLNDDV